jgi:hypothetical protein
MIEGRTSLAIAMVVVGAIGAVIGLAVVNLPRISLPIHFDSGDTSVERLLAEAADRYNRMLPMMVDSETRADNLTPLPPNTLIYRYTLVKRTKGNLNANVIVKKMRPIIINAYRTTDSLKTLRDAGVTIVYDYYDKNGIYITEIVVKTSDLE